MASLIPFISKRGVRSLNSIYFRAPWPFVKNRNTGWRKIGPMHFEKQKYPGQEREFPEISPKFMKNNDERLRGMLLI